VRLVYQGQPHLSELGGFRFDTHNNQPMIWTLNESFGARNWWPCKDVSADKVASVDIHIAHTNTRK